MSFELANLDGTAPDTAFPDPRGALDEHFGLIAMGGDWHPQRVLNAYRHGIFPWPMPGLEMGWYCPPERMLIPSDAVHISRRARRALRNQNWTVTADHAFGDVMKACAQPRDGSQGTWITASMVRCYSELHVQGRAHSIEVRDPAGNLVGGTFGIFVRGVFCGDSMFSRESGGSKVALAALGQFLNEHDVQWIDAQLPTPHLCNMGGVEMDREAFLKILLSKDTHPTLGQRNWKELFGHRSVDTILEAYRSANNPPRLQIVR